MDSDELVADVAELGGRTKVLESMVGQHQKQLADLTVATDATSTTVIQHSERIAQLDERGKAMSDTAARIETDVRELRDAHKESAGRMLATDRWLRTTVALVTITGAVIGGAVTLFTLVIERGM